MKAPGGAEKSFRGLFRDPSPAFLDFGAPALSLDEFPFGGRGATGLPAARLRAFGPVPEKCFAAQGGEFFGQTLPGGFPVGSLTAGVADGHGDPGGKVGQENGGGDLVHMLPARPRGTCKPFPQVLLAELRATFPGYGNLWIHEGRWRQDAPSPKKTHANALAMSLRHETVSTPHATLDLLEDAASGIRIVVNRLGAEVISLAKRDDSGEWRGFLWRDGQSEPPASGWGNHATVMGYYTHRLWEQKSVYDGHPLDGGPTPHGFLRHHGFAAPRVDPEAGSLTYRFAAEAIPPGAYPYKVSAEITYTLAGGALRAAFSFRNHEEHPVALSFGWHPGFAVSSVAAASVLLPAGTYRQQIATENFLTGGVREIVFGGGEMPFAKETLVDSYLIDLADVPERRFAIEDRVIGHRVVCDYAEAPYLTIWSNGDPFVCVEPCWGLPDSNPPVPFERKAGIQRIAAGSAMTASVTVTPSFLH